MKNKITTKFFSILLSALLIFGGFFYFPVQTRALDADVKINEVVYAPLDGVEWVELYNAGPDDVDLNDWVLTDEDGAYEYIFTSAVIFTPGTFLVIRSDDGIDDIDFSDGVGTIYADHGSDYANTIDQISLYNSSATLDDTTIIDFMAWGGDSASDDDNAVGAGIWTDGEYLDNIATGNSLGLIIDGDDNNDLSDWQEFDNPTMGISNEYVNQSPVISAMWADPDPITADGSSYILFSAETSDPDGMADIALVEIDLSEVGGDANQMMYDDGSNGDDVLGDGIYSYETTIPMSITAGNYQLPISVYDAVDNSDIQDLSIDVEEIVYAGDIRLNEILPNPSGSETTDEYIEIYNYSSSMVDLEGWYIEDASGADYIIDSADFSSTNILAGGYITIYRDISGIALNNSGDIVYLYQPNNNELDRVEYVESSDEDNSYNFNSGSWEWSTTLTPNALNVITRPNDPPVANAGGNIDVYVGDSITFDGIDSSDPDGDDLIYSWDFGDSNNGTGCSTTHTYQTAGNYTVTLHVSDGYGGQDEDTIEVEVSESEAVQLSGPFSNKIVVNEYLPNPNGSDNDSEFIELKNIGSSSVDLSGWQIDDEDGGSNPYIIPNGTEIAGGGFLTFYRSDSGISINNSGDSVRVLSPDGKVASEQRYEGTARDDESYARNSSGSFQWTTTLTPGEENIINEPASEEDVQSNTSSTTSTSSSSSSSTEENVILVTISQAKAKEKNTEVKVRGIVTVPPNIVNATYFYIQDDTAGVQIYFSKKDFPNLKLGDEIEVTGKISERSGEKKINIADKTDIKIISSGRNRSPAEIKTGDVKENFEGSLVRMYGQITKQSGNTIYIDDGSGEIKIYIQKTTGIKKPEWKKGDWVTITGIVGQTSTGYRVMPRYQEDLQAGKFIEGEGDIPAAGMNWKLLTVLLGAAGALVLKKY